MDNKKLLVFHHGLGDLLLFLPLFQKLKEIGNYTLALQAGCGFTPLVSESVETPVAADYDKFCKENGYSGYQIVRFDMAEGSNYTKTELCAIQEFGFTGEKLFRKSPLTPLCQRGGKDSENPSVCSLMLSPNGLIGHLFPLRQRGMKGDFPNTASNLPPSKIIGVHFQGTCLPDQTNPDEETAKKIWEEIKEAGFIPLEIHFEHLFHNPVNKKWDWVDRTTRGISPHVFLLRAVLSGCAGFIGAASGVWVMAVYELSSRNVLFLEKHHKLENYFHSKDLQKIDINNYQEGSVKKWLYKVSGR